MRFNLNFELWRKEEATKVLNGSIFSNFSFIVGLQWNKLEEMD